MTLAELAAATGLTTNDLIGIWDAEASSSTEPTQKLTAQQLAAAVKGLANLIGTSDLDDTPTAGSNKAVKSGGVYTAIQQSTASLQNQINQKQNKIEDEGVGFTAASGITSNLFIRRYGNVVCINGFLQSTNNFPSSETVVGSIAANNRPSGAVRLPARTANAAYEVGSPAYVNIATNGNIAVTASSGTTHKVCYFSATYIV